MQYTVICVGKIKERYFSDAIKEYEKRLSRYGKLEIKEVADEKTPDGASENLQNQIKEKEADRILKQIKDGMYVVALDIQGKEYDSVSFASRLNHLMVSGESHIVFIIGGSLGLHSSVLKRAHVRISFSKMTFPHQLMRVILLEQIYRANRILKNEPYHK